ncbi:MAG: AAA family ATPase [Lacipirellulaceae bacterium]
MHIHQFTVRNFLIHQTTTVDLSPLSVLVGANGAGKSAFFDALLNFSMLSRGNIQQAFGPYPFSYNATIYRGATAGVSRIGFAATMSQERDSSERYKYEITYEQVQGQSPPRYSIINEKLTNETSGSVEFDRTDPDAYEITSKIRLEQDRCLFSAIRLARATQEFSPFLDYLTQQISRMNKFRLDPFSLATPSRVPQIDSEPTSGLIPRIGYNGEDLAATLYYLANTEDPAFELIKQRIRDLVAEFEDFEFSTVGTDKIAFAVKYSDRRETVPSVRLSSGMLIFIGLICLVSTPNRPPVLMVEEPENGLTPQAIKVFYDAVRSLAFSDDIETRSQVLISSHSPFVICDAWNGEDRDFIHQVRVNGGRSQVRKFSEVIGEHGIQLGKVDGDRTHLSLKNAEDVMSGRFAG